MLRVTVELVPFGREADSRVIGRLTIANQTGGGPFADYHVLDELKSRPSLVVRLRRHDRARSFWALVQKACHWADRIATPRGTDLSSRA